MFEFELPWIFLLLPLPWLIHRFLPPIETGGEAALRVPFADELGIGEAEQDKPLKLILMLLVTAWLLLLSAAARPVWVGDAVQVPVSGRDLLLAVDLSGSMQVEDFRIGSNMVNRLTATKAVLGEFIKRRDGDRLGLILFGSQAYLQTPLTFDRQTVNQLLQESAIGLAGQETAIGDAIGLAIKKLKDHPDDQKVAILITDGANTSGEVQPIKAAELAAEQGVKIYTVGIGADEMIVQSFFGSQRINPSADLDEKTLTAIAEKTGGRYFRARDSAQLEQIYAMLDELEPVERDTRQFRPQQSLFFWPLAAAIFIAGIPALLRLRGRVA